MADEKKSKVRSKGEPKEDDEFDTDKKEYNFNKKNAKELGSKGGQISGEVRRRKKNMREMAKALLDLPLTNKQTIEGLKKLGIDAEDCTNQMALLVRMMQLALEQQDVKAATFLRDTAGYDNATMAKLGIDTEEEDDDLVIYIPTNNRDTNIEAVPIEETGMIIDEPTKAGDGDGSQGD